MSGLIVESFLLVSQSFFTRKNLRHQLEDNRCKKFSLRSMRASQKGLGLGRDAITSEPEDKHKEMALPDPELLEDLGSRFVLNVPAEDLESFERVMFAVEQAHWFYEDAIRDKNPNLRQYSLREFTTLLFQNCAALQPYLVHLNAIYKSFTMYKVRVPTVGAILLNRQGDKCIMVKGWKSGATWGFPKGKKSKDEQDPACAVREVFEEVGIDVSGRLQPSDYLEVEMGQQRSRLYLVPGFDELLSVECKTKKEISEIAWHYVEDLPTASLDTPVQNRGRNGAKYFMVWPFVGPLQQWLASQGLGARAGARTGPNVISLWKTSGAVTPVLPPVGAPAQPRSSLESLLVPQASCLKSFRFDPGPILSPLTL